MMRSLCRYVREHGVPCYVIAGGVLAFGRFSWRDAGERQVTGWEVTILRTWAQAREWLGY